MKKHNLTNQETAINALVNTNVVTQPFHMRAGGTGLCLISPFFAQADAPGQLFQSCVESVNHMSDSTFWTLVRLAFLLIATTIVCGRTHSNQRDRIERWTLSTLLWVVASAVSFLILALPTPHLTFFGPSRAFVFAMSLVAIFVLPWRLARLLLPVAKLQNALAIVLYALAGLFLLSTVFGS